MRPELAITNHKGDIKPNLQYYTWKNPRRCDESGQIIYDYTYFHYHKPSLGNGKTPAVDYYCSLESFERLAPIDGFKYPMNKII